MDINIALDDGETQMIFKKGKVKKVSAELTLIGQHPELDSLILVS